MRPLNKKSRPQRLLETVTHSLDLPGRSKSRLPGVGSDKTLKIRWPEGKSLNGGLSQENALKAGVIAGGVAALTMGSAGISALRRRTERATLDS